MDIEQISEIVKRANLRAIAKGLKKAGYKNCVRDRLLRRASLCDIAAAGCGETPYFSDGRGNEFIGTLCRSAKGYERYEFIIVEQLSPIKRGCDDLFTKKMLIYAK